jgi:hypothetical protein
VLCPRIAKVGADGRRKYAEIWPGDAVVLRRKPPPVVKRERPALVTPDAGADSSSEEMGSCAHDKLLASCRPQGCCAETRDGMGMGSWERDDMWESVIGTPHVVGLGRVVVKSASLCSSSTPGSVVCRV